VSARLDPDVFAVVEEVAAGRKSLSGVAGTSRGCGRAAARNFFPAGQESSGSHLAICCSL